jgi:hypothetical protein
VVVRTARSNKLQRPHKKGGHRTQLKLHRALCRLTILCTTYKSRSEQREASDAHPNTQKCLTFGVGVERGVPIAVKSDANFAVLLVLVFVSVQLHGLGVGEQHVMGHHIRFGGGIAGAAFGRLRRHRRLWGGGRGRGGVRRRLLVRRRRRRRRGSPHRVHSAGRERARTAAARRMSARAITEPRKCPRPTTNA